MHHDVASKMIILFNHNGDAVTILDKSGVLDGK